MTASYLTASLLHTSSGAVPAQSSLLSASGCSYRQESPGPVARANLRVRPGLRSKDHRETRDHQLLNKPANQALSQPLRYQNAPKVNELLSIAVSPRSKARSAARMKS